MSQYDRDRDDVNAVYASQGRLTRKVARGLLMFLVVWIPALLIVPAVFKQGAITSGLMATTAAIIVTVVLERTWMKPRAAAKERRSAQPDPPVDTRSSFRRRWDDLTARVQK